jgi:ribosomal peptide maturation radical SAM protein 1
MIDKLKSQSTPINKQVPNMLLVSMPWRIADCPNLALGMLKPLIENAGVACEVLEAGLMTAVRTPGELYRIIGSDPAGELAFAPFAYDDVSMDEARQRLRHYFPSLCGEGWDATLAVDCAGGILEQLEGQMDWTQYDFVGFSLTFQQTLASVALAHRIRRQNPHVRIVIGGACCEGLMGAALLEEFACFDFACSGRMEGVIGDVVAAMRGQLDPAEVPGLAHRDANGAVMSCDRQPPRVCLDTLPLPDFDDYFRTRRLLGLNLQGTRLLLETSVGCWWGEKHLCSFCGLNATSLAYRQKSGERVLYEIRELSRRYKIDAFELVDNILPMSFFKDLLPKLANMPETLTFFAEVKSNLRKEQITLLAAAGFRFLQPGIESFDDHILTLMDKGCRGIGQVQFIKWCDEFGIDTAYSMLVSNPGERAEDYDRMTEWIPSLVHLTPPFGEPVDIQLVRFSPYFQRRHEFGIGEPRPAAIFREIFPHAPEARLAKMVFMFELEHPALSDPELVRARNRFRLAIKRWRAVHRPGLLVYRRGANWLCITDVRRDHWHGEAVKARRVTLRGAQAKLYAFCDQARSHAQLAQAFPELSQQQIDGLLSQLVKERLLLDDGERVLALAVDAARLQLKAPQVAPLVPVESPFWEDLLNSGDWTVQMRQPSRRRRRPPIRFSVVP